MERLSAINRNTKLLKKINKFLKPFTIDLELAVTETIISQLRCGVE